MTTLTKKSSAILKVSFSENTNQVYLTFVSSPTKEYPYTVAEGKFEDVQKAFTLTESFGVTYHELVKNSLISPSV